MQKRFLKLFPLVLVLCLSIKAPAQTRRKAVSDSIYLCLQADKKGRDWRYDTSNSVLTWKLRGTIYFEPWCCGPAIVDAYLHTLDSVQITLRFEEGWDAEKVKKCRSENKIIIDVLKEEFISYAESKNWQIKVNKESFVKYPYTTLKGHRGFDVKGSYNLKNVVRIPDKIINGVGLYLDVYPSYEWYAIYQEGPRAKFDAQLLYVSHEILKSKELVFGRFAYE